jgi:hypothetical protein
MLYIQYCKSILLSKIFKNIFNESRKKLVKVCSGPPSLTDWNKDLCELASESYCDKEPQ